MAPQDEVNMEPRGLARYPKQAAKPALRPRYIHSDEGRAGRRTDERETRPVEHERFATLDDDVARVVRLGDPQGAFDAAHPGAFTVIDPDELAGAEALPQVVRMCIHCSHSLIHPERATGNGGASGSRQNCIAVEGGSNERFSSMDESNECKKCR